MQSKSPLDTGFLAPQFAAGRRNEDWPGVQEELQVLSRPQAPRPPPTQVAQHPVYRNALPGTLQDALQATLGGTDLAPGPKVSIRRARRLDVAPVAQEPHGALQPASARAGGL
jgi:hypothetical protein